MATTLAIAATILLASAAISAQEDLDALRRRAEQGDAEAQYSLAVMYDNGEGVLEDDAEAVRWYRLGRRSG